MFLSPLYQQLKTEHWQLKTKKTTKNCQNFLAKVFKNQSIGMNIKQKVRIKLQQTSLDIFLNQTLTDCFY